MFFGNKNGNGRLLAKEEKNEQTIEWMNKWMNETKAEEENRM